MHTDKNKIAKDEGITRRGELLCPRKSLFIIVHLWFSFLFIIPLPLIPLPSPSPKPKRQARNGQRNRCQGNQRHSRNGFIVPILGALASVPREAAMGRGTRRHFFVINFPVSFCFPLSTFCFPTFPLTRTRRIQGPGFKVQAW